jgi:hypothetical protein
MRWLALLLCAGCMTPADDRARRDEEIGRASAGEARVEVAGGLAAVLAFAPGELVLWAGAPALDLTLSGAGPWTITARNLLSDARLSGAAGVVEEAGRIPTEKRWRIAGGGELALRLAPPDEADTGRFRFGVLADVQGAVGSVWQIYERMRADPSLRFVLFSGDLTEVGTRAELERFRREHEALPVPIYATLGNHELGAAGPPFHDFYGRGSWSFAYRGIRVTALDSASATLAPAVHDWLAGWLDEGRDRFHLVFMHIPTLDPVGLRNGGFASRAEGHALARAFARAGVDVAIYGHVHSYYSFSHAGVPAYISGGGGAIPERFDGIGRHYLVVDVDPPTQRFEVSVVRVD